MPLRGISTPVASLGPPASGRDTFDSRWPSVDTMRAVAPSDSNSTPARCWRVSSSDTEKIVFAIMSRSTAELDLRTSAPPAIAGSFG